MKYYFVISCQGDEEKTVRLRGWVDDLGWLIQRDYLLFTMVDYKNTPVEIILTVDDPNKATLVKLAWG